LNCKSVIRELSNYIDGDLEPAVKQELERHLAHCEDCTMVVDQTRKTIELYCDSEPVALPKDVHNRLHESLRKKSSPPEG
jgi:anti-sigma factor RsiW